MCMYITSLELCAQLVVLSFSNRRINANIMEDCKNLKHKACCDTNGHYFGIYIHDSLTRRRANLDSFAYQLKTSQYISYTLIAFGKVQINDNHGHIKALNPQGDIRKLET